MQADLIIIVAFSMPTSLVGYWAFTDKKGFDPADQRQPPTFSLISFALLLLAGTILRLADLLLPSVVLVVILALLLGASRPRSYLKWLCGLLGILAVWSYRERYVAEALHAFLLSVVPMYISWFVPKSRLP